MRKRRNRGATSQRRSKTDGSAPNPTLTRITWRDLCDGPDDLDAVSGGGLSEEEEAYLDLMLRNRPKTRADCEGGLRPCPYLGCKYHTAIEVLHRKVRVHETPLSAYSCVLDVIDDWGALAPAQIDELLGFKEPYASYIIEHALGRIRGSEERREMLEEFADAGDQPRPARY